MTKEMMREIGWLLPCGAVVKMYKEGVEEPVKTYHMLGMKPNLFSLFGVVVWYNSGDDYCKTRKIVRFTDFLYDMGRGLKPEILYNYHLDSKEGSEFHNIFEKAFGKDSSKTTAERIKEKALKDSIKLIKSLTKDYSPDKRG